MGLFALFSVAVGGAAIISMGWSTFSLIACSTYALYTALGFQNIMNVNIELAKVMGIYKILTDKFGNIHEDELYQTDPTNQQLQDYQHYLQKLECFPINADPMAISIKNVNYEYSLDSQESKQIFHNLELSVQPGAVMALIGSSGKGKSTLLNIITKLLKCNSGEILLDGKPIDQVTFEDIQREISFVTQESILFKGTLE